MKAAWTQLRWPELCTTLTGIELNVVLRFILQNVYTIIYAVYMYLGGGWGLLLKVAPPTSDPADLDR